GQRRFHTAHIDVGRLWFGLGVRHMGNLAEEEEWPPKVESSHWRKRSESAFSCAPSPFGADEVDGCAIRSRLLVHHAAKHHEPKVADAAARIKWRKLL
ncbi:hypothetical protein, partial [Ruegeria sp. HKCCD8929]|uniref:hypothetical protein n=1 Tax=Ruegeria sp. HKCCD8929 TaxID=2683006 RepID=UPI001489079F